MEGAGANPYPAGGFGRRGGGCCPYGGAAGGKPYEDEYIVDPVSGKNICEFFELLSKIVIIQKF
jgi:hypothetical protein